MCLRVGQGGERNNNSKPLLVSSVGVFCIFGGLGEDAIQTYLNRLVYDIYIHTYIQFPLVINDPVVFVIITG